MKKNIMFNQCDSVTFGVPYFDNIEHLENVFDITFSCGDGLFYDDLEEALQDRYDGKVDTRLFRENLTLKEHTDSILSMVYDSEKEGHGYEPNECYSNIKIKETRRKPKP